MKAKNLKASTGHDLDTGDTARPGTVDAAETIGIADVTPRNFVRWALERFPKGRLFK
jgi:hypothetical protein